jgi:tetratricopeptide (TPR) repeat protein
MSAAALQGLCDQGFALHQAGRLEEARARYDAILRQDPDHFNALYLLGTLYAQAGHSEPGASLLKRAIAVNPNVASAHGLLSLALIDLKRPSEALESLARAIALDPSYVDAHYSRGLAFSQLQRREEALASYDAAIALQPDHAEAHNNRGIILGELARPDEALASFDAAIRASPGFAEAHNNRGALLHALGRAQASLESCERAVALKPDYARAHFNRGVALFALNRPREAVASYAAAIAIDPGDARVLEAHGSALQALGRHEEALASLDRAITLRPDSLEVHNNRGSALYELARLDEALASYDAALALNPDHVEVRTNRAAALLLAGRFEAGWRDFEWRKKTWTAPWSRLDPARAWRGEESLEGRRLFVHHEQGLGDTIQFCRYIALLRDRGADLICSVQPALWALLEPLSPGREPLSGDEAPTDFDHHCSLMSLPLAFRTDLESIPAFPRYLHADEARGRRLETVLGVRTKPRIGLAWSGNPAHANDRNRSIAFETLSPLLGAHAEWICLQNQVRPGDAAALHASGRVRFLGEALRDFADTAALADQMDLVITVDTSIAHLAGALGKPVWILLPFRPDWRWMLRRRDSPWYPSARLFRQPRIGDWASVIEEVGAEFGSRAG